MFWDAFDTNADSRDTVSKSEQLLFDVLVEPLSVFPPTTLSEAWIQVRVDPGLVGGTEDDLDLGAITTDHAIGPDSLLPAAGTNVKIGTVFQWSKAVGCSAGPPNPNLGDEFELIFFDPDTFAELFRVDSLTTNSHALTGPQFWALAANDMQFGWAVHGSNTVTPSTGPYLGDSLAGSALVPSASSVALWALRIAALAIGVAALRGRART